MSAILDSRPSHAIWNVCICMSLCTSCIKVAQMCKCMVDICRVMTDSVARGTLIYKMRAFRIEFHEAALPYAAAVPINKRAKVYTQTVQSATIALQRHTPSSSTRVYRYGDPLMPRGENAIRECNKLPMPKISLCCGIGRKGGMSKIRNPSQETNANIQTNGSRSVSCERGRRLRIWRSSRNQGA